MQKGKERRIRKRKMRKRGVVGDRKNKI